MSKVDIKFMDENEDMRMCRTPLFFEANGNLFVVLSSFEGTLHIANITTGKIYDNGFYTSWDDFYATYGENTKFKNVEIIASPMRSTNQSV